MSGGPESGAPTRTSQERYVPMRPPSDASYDLPPRPSRPAYPPPHLDPVLLPPPLPLSTVVAPALPRLPSPVPLPTTSLQALDIANFGGDAASPPVTAPSVSAPSLAPPPPGLDITFDARIPTAPPPPTPPPVVAPPPPPPRVPRTHTSSTLEADALDGGETAGDVRVAVGDDFEKRGGESTGGEKAAAVAAEKGAVGAGKDGKMVTGKDRKGVAAVRPGSGEEIVASLLHLVLGVLLGLVFSVFSFIFNCCVPSMEGRPWRRNFFNIGCAIGVVTQVCLLAILGLNIKKWISNGLDNE